MEKVIEYLLKNINSNGGQYWSHSDGSVYNPIGFSSIEILSVIGDVLQSSSANYAEFAEVKEALSFLLSYYNPAGKMFCFSPAKRMLHCVSAKITAVLQKFRVHSDCFNSVYSEMLTTQRDDGGWRCPTVKIGRSPETDASNPGTTLYVLDAFRLYWMRSDIDGITEKYRRNCKGEWTFCCPIGNRNGPSVPVPLG